MTFLSSLQKSHYIDMLSRFSRNLSIPKHDYYPGIERLARRVFGVDSFHVAPATGFSMFKKRYRNDSARKKGVRIIHSSESEFLAAGHEDRKATGFLIKKLLQEDDLVEGISR